MVIHPTGLKTVKDERDSRTFKDDGELIGQASGREKGEGWRV